MALSDWLAPTLQAGSTILQAGSQVARGAAGKTIAARRQALDEFEAQQLEQEAAQSRGVGMRGAADETLKTEYLNSTALARAAASGAGASDPTVMNVIARTAGEGAYRSALAMYEGEAQARMDMVSAGAKRYEGAVGAQDAATAAKISNMGAANTLLTGGVKAMSMYEKYFSGPVKSNSAGLDTSGTSGVSASSGNAGWLDAGTSIPDTNS